MMIPGTRNNKSRSNSNSNSNSAFYTLLDRIQGLSFRPFQMCVLLWLGVKGLSNIRPLGRLHRRGRRPQGGADFLAKTSGTGVELAIQIRHWKSPIQRRAVDELWGFMLRRGVPLGLIVTNSRFMKSAEKAALEYPGRPIQLVSARQLCSSMAALELGLTKAGPEWMLDESFFRSVDQLSFASMLGKESVQGRPARALVERCHLAGLLGEPSQPKSGPPSSSLWQLLAAVALALALLLWFAHGGWR